MKRRTLSIIWLLAAAIVMGGHADRADAGLVQNGSLATADSVVLVGASGHDSVGSLLPLPLMPSPRFRLAGRPWKGKGHACCYAKGPSGKTRQY